MKFNPDNIIYFQWGWFYINATLLFSWIIIAILAGLSIILTFNLKTEGKLSKLQIFLESTIRFLLDQVKMIFNEDEKKYLPFLGTLFLFISLSNFLELIPYFLNPFSSLSTTLALAITVFFAVPIFGITHKGIKGYLLHYIKPSIFVLPFTIISEISRTLALGIRLFGNIMSTGLIASILLIITPLFIPIIMQLFGLFIGQIQAYIFTLLSAIFISSGMKAAKNQQKEKL